MKNIAIVGVEGSGKTALMISWGWHYQHPDRQGYYLTPDPKGGQNTLDYVCSKMDSMRKGKWPIATSSDTGGQTLDWILGYKGSSLGEISFVDFGGELYRKAFNDGPAAALALKERTVWDKLAGKPVQEDTPAVRLQRHVKNCKALVILINLAEIINDPQMTSPKTRQMVAIVKSMIEVVRRQRGMTGGVAIVFTQADIYADTLEKAGSLENAYLTYLPVIASHFPKLRLFAVSAVNKTIPSDDGLPVPADNFAAEGLEKLTAWVAMWTDAWIVDVNLWFLLLYLLIPLCWPYLIFCVLPRKWRFWRAEGWRIKRNKK